MNLTNLLSLLEILRKQPTWSINGIEGALKYSPEAVGKWNVDLLTDMVSTVLALEAGLTSAGLDFPGVKADMERFKKIPSIYDIMHPRPKKGKK